MSRRGGARPRTAAGWLAFSTAMAFSLDGESAAMTDWHAPHDHPPSADLDEETRRELLGRVLHGVELGAHDKRVGTWLAGQNMAVVRSVVAW